MTQVPERVLGTPLLEVRDVEKSFRRRNEINPVIDNINMRVNKGEFVSVVGPSGCGKSTLFTMLAGLVTPDSGDVLVDGQSVLGSTKKFAYMPQRDLLFPWLTLTDNAALGLTIQGVNKREARARVAELLPVFGLDGYADAYSFELSGGMRQRGALLRTVLQDRPILLLDEPFGALDFLTRTELQFWLSSMATEFGWTVVLITHDVPEAVLLSDRVYVLSRRPANVQLTLEIDLPKPRNIDVVADPRFGEYEHALLEELRLAASPDLGAAVRR